MGQSVAADRVVCVCVCVCVYTHIYIYIHMCVCVCVCIKNNKWDGVSRPVVLEAAYVDGC
jgi:hypothetical protein